MADTVTLTADQIEALALKALVASGTREDNARPLAVAARLAEIDGISSHGLAYIPIYCEHVQCGKVDGQATPVVETPRPGSITVDAATGFAHPAIAAGFDRLVPAARDNGIAGLSIRNSYNCGVLGHHVEKLAEAGLIGIGFTNAPASIAPSGGTRPVVGTNPFAVAVPDGKGGAAILIDQSASVIAKSELMKRAREGDAIPEGWALGPDGEATTDPNVGLKGTMAPSGGYKGVGVAMFVEIMAAAASGATLGKDASPFSGTAGGPPRTGQFFIAVDGDLFSGGAMGERIAALTGAVSAQDGARYPGQGRSGARARSLSDGVAVNRALFDRVSALAEA